MIPRPPRSTRTDTLFPYTTLFRSTGLRRVRVAKKFEPQAPAPLVKIKVAPIGPVGRWRQYPSTLNRPKEKSAEGGESHQLGHVIGLAHPIIPSRMLWPFTSVSARRRAASAPSRTAGMEAAACCIDRKSTRLNSSH